jgi:hypothetical protein
MRVLEPAAAYFALVFGAGFVLGAIRVSWIVPSIGARAAVLVETPVMLAVSALAARWTNRRLAPVSGTAYYLALGVFAILPWLLGRRAVGAR